MRRWASDPPPRLPPFPWLHTLLLAPAAAAAAAAPRTRAWPARAWPAAAVLLLWVCLQDGAMVALSLRSVLVHGCAALRRGAFARGHGPGVRHPARAACHASHRHAPRHRRPHIAGPPPVDTASPDRGMCAHRLTTAKAPCPGFLAPPYPCSHAPLQLPPHRAAGQAARPARRDRAAARRLCHRRAPRRRRRHQRLRGPAARRLRRRGGLCGRGG